MKLEQREIYLLKRRKLGLTLQTIALIFKVHKSTVSRWETGKIPIPNEYMEWIDTIEKENN